MNKESIAVTLVLAPKSPCILRTEFDTSQLDRLVADPNTALGHKNLNIAVAQIEAMIEPDDVLNDRGWKSVACLRR